LWSTKTKQLHRFFFFFFFFKRKENDSNWNPFFGLFVPDSKLAQLQTPKNHNYPLGVDFSEQVSHSMLQFQRHRSKHSSSKTPKKEPLHCLPTQPLSFLFFFSSFVSHTDSWTQQTLSLHER
jgi:hypothetical protein